MPGLQKTYSNSFVIHDGNDRSFSMYGGQEDEKFMLPKFYNEQGDKNLYVFIIINYFVY